MKRKYIAGQIAIIFLALLTFTVFALIGCSKEEESIVGPSPSIEAVMLVCNPLAPAPGDVATLTLETSGYSNCGLPEVYWTAEAGSLYANQGMTVNWKVPDTTGVFRISARCVVDGVSDTISRYVAVRNFERLDSGVFVSFGIHFCSDMMFFIGSDISTSSSDFHDCFDIFRYIEGNSVKITVNDRPEINGGESFSYHGTKLLGSFLINYSEHVKRQIKNVVFFTIYPFPNKTFVTNDESGKFNRYNQHTFHGAMTIYQ